MPIFHKDGKFLLYVHIPKTGGSYIENFFFKNGYDVGMLDRGLHKPFFNKVRLVSPQHMHAELLEATLDLTAFDLVFMSVRHPVSRLLSEYRMRLDPANPVDFNDWFADMYEQYLLDPFVSDNHLRPQHEFVLESAHVFKQEEGFDAAWADRLEAEFGLEFHSKEFARSETSQHKIPFSKSTDQISAENKSKILELYQKDFDLFGYELKF